MKRVLMIAGLITSTDDQARFLKRILLSLSSMRPDISPTNLNMLYYDRHAAEGKDKFTNSPAMKFSQTEVPRALLVKENDEILKGLDSIPDEEFQSMMRSYNVDLVLVNSSEVFKKVNDKLGNLPEFKNIVLRLIPVWNLKKRDQ